MKMLFNYTTGEELRRATAREFRASKEAAKYDGGAGVILIYQGQIIINPMNRYADQAMRCFVAEGCQCTLVGEGPSPQEETR